MITVNGRVFKLKIDGIEIASTVFDNLTLIEEFDGKIPLLQVNLIDRSYSIVKNIKKNRTKLSFYFGIREDTLENYDFIITNYDIIQSTHKNIRLYCMLDMGKYNTEYKQKVYSNQSALEILQSLISIKLKTNLTKTTDSQNWIQANQTDRQFIDQMLLSSYISDKDSIVYGINTDGTLVVHSVYNAFHATEKLCFTNSTMKSYDKPQVPYSLGFIQSNNSIYTYLFGEGAKLPVISLNKSTVDLLSIDNSSVVNGENYDNFDSNNNYPIVLDCLNCHDNFHKAKLINQTRKALLQRNQVEVSVTINFLNNQDLKLLDTVKFVETMDDPDGMLFNGLYLITKKVINVSSTAWVQTYTLSRDFYLENKI